VSANHSATVDAAVLVGRVDAVISKLDNKTLYVSAGDSDAARKGDRVNGLAGAPYKESVRISLVHYANHVQP
jgi:hypothetical protein